MSPKAGATLGLVVRVSQVKGREGERFQSPVDQIAEGTAHATKAGYKVRVFDADAQGKGVSGGTPFDQRPGMSEALALVESGELAGIVVAAQDRLVRQKRDGAVTLAQIQQRIKDAGAVLLIADNSAAEVRDPNEDLATGYAAAGSDVRALADQWVREEAAKKWGKAKRNAIEAGRYVGAAPRGYVKQEDGTLAISSAAEAKTIRAAFELRIKGGTWTDVLHVLRAGGIACANPSSARALIQCPAYRGAAVLAVKDAPSLVNESAHEAIVQPATWHAAQEKKGQAVSHRRAQGEAVGSVLAGLLFCGTCETRLTAGQSVRGDKTYGFYTCRNFDCKDRASISYGVIHHVIEDRLMTSFEGYVPPAEKVDPELQLAVDSAERELAAMSSLSVADLGADLFRTMHAERRQAVEDARKALSEAVAATMVTPEERAFHEALQAEDPRAIRKLWDSYDVRRRREIVRLHDPEGWTVKPGRAPLHEKVTSVKTGRGLVDARA